MNLPQEIQDIIFLLLDYKTLESCRELQSNYIKKCTQFNILFLAIKNKNMHNVKWLHQQGITHIYSSLSELVYEEHSIDILELMYKYGIRQDKDTFVIAARMGRNVEIIKWLYSKGLRPDIEVFRAAALNGNLDNIKWLVAQGCERDLSIFTYTVKSGNLDTLKWMHYSLGYLGYKYSMEYAVKCGNVEILKWLIEIGNTPDSSLLHIAISSNSKDIIKILKQTIVQGEQHIYPRPINEF